MQVKAHTLCVKKSLCVAGDIINARAIFLFSFLVPCIPNLSLYRKVRGWILPKFYNTENKVIYSTSVTSGASQGPHSFNSRSYAEDVTSVTSGASQGPHSFNLVFVCLFVCVTPGAIPYLSRTVPSNTAGHIQLAAIFK